MKEINIYEERRKRAVETLVKLGAMKYFSDLDLYHGRAGDGSEWKVKTNFNNAGNATGNRNVNKLVVCMLLKNKLQHHLLKNALCS